jgi:hypothetical protein
VKQFEYKSVNRVFDSVNVPTDKLRALCDDWMNEWGVLGWRVFQMNQYQGDYCLSVVLILEREGNRES